MSSKIKLNLSVETKIIFFRQNGNYIFEAGHSNMRVYLDWTQPQVVIGGTVEVAAWWVVGHFLMDLNRLTRLGELVWLVWCADGIEKLCRWATNRAMIDIQKQSPFSLIMTNQNRGN